MKSTLIFLSLIVLFAKSKSSYFDVGHDKAIFYNFINLSKVNLQPLNNSTGSYTPRHILDPTVEKFYYNIGSAAHDCPVETIACIKFYKDNQFYALSNSKDWSLSETGNNVSFDDQTTISFTPKNSITPIGPAKRIGSIKFVFECSLIFSNTTLAVVNNTYDYTLIIRDPYACQKNLNNFLLFLSTFSFVLGGISIVLGAFLVSFGLKIFKITLFSVGAIPGFFLIPIIFTQIYVDADSYPFWLYVVNFLGGMICAFALGYLFTIISKAGIIALGSFFGIIFWILVYDALLTRTPLYSLYIGCAIFVWVFGLLAYFFPLYLSIISTEFIGSYFLIRGIAFFAGGFPNALLIYDIIQSGGHFNNLFYLYLGVILILAIGIFIIQEKYNSKENMHPLLKAKEKNDPKLEGLTVF